MLRGSSLIAGTAFALAHAVAAVAGASADPQADPKAVIVEGQARFTVLTPRLVRMEWSPASQFEDRASHVVINRRLPVPEFRTKREDGWLEVQTESLTLRYRQGAPFDGENLSIRCAAGQVTWTAASKDDQNLRGTWRTLDSVSGASQLEPGLLSRSGWTLLDDSQRLLFDNSDWPWAAPRDKPGNLDWYFFCYGTQYVQCLQDFTAIAGRIPLPPRYVFGAWWSRYWAYSDAELRQLVGEFREHDVPLDVLVVDMDWHLDGWTGYTWNPKYFPDPKGFLDWTAEQGLMTTLNLHPADGVGKHEAAFEDFCKAMGLDPATTERIPFDCTDRKYVDAYFRLLHHPLEVLGVDFWWMDWQQGKDSPIPGLDPLWWLNYLHWTDWERNPGAKHERPLIFSRWGGLGNHRYQIGFSGDTYCNWPSLAFQPYFTATAANVCYPYWSHDIGGHMPGPVDPELYGRWIQWGALSPVLRTHTTKNPKAERRIWAFDEETFRVAREAWRLRYALIPYIYNAARQAHDSAMPLCRPLYYLWPELEDAYTRTGQYMFGDDLLAAPVVEPVDPMTQCAAVAVWLPPGRWINWFTGRTYEGPSEVRLLVPRDEIPLFAGEGAIIPLAPPMKHTRERPLDPLIFDIFPGPDRESVVYEDDGLTQDYLSGEYSMTPIRVQRTAESGIVAVGPVEGGYRGMPAQRSYEFRLRATAPPSEILLDGRPLAAAPAGEVGWHFDAASLTLVIRTLAMPVEKQVRVDFSNAGSAALNSQIERGLVQLRRLLAEIVRRCGDGAPPSVAETLARIDAGKFDGLDGAGLRLARDISASTLQRGLRERYAARLLGLYARLDIRGTGDRDMEAIVQAALSPLMGGGGAAPPHDVRFEPPANWSHEAPRRAVEKLNGGGELTTVRTALHPASTLQTAQLRATVELRIDDRPITLPLEKLILPGINAWWLLGPFEREGADRYDERLAGLQTIDPTQDLPGKDGKPARWQQVRRELTTGADLGGEYFVDFLKVYGHPTDDASASAFCYLKSPRDMEADLALGSDDNVVVWVNHEKVFEFRGGRAYTPKQDRIRIKLKAGLNTLALRIDQYHGGWAFGVHVEALDGSPLTEVEASLDP